MDWTTNDEGENHQDPDVVAVPATDETSPNEGDAPTGGDGPAQDDAVSRTVTSDAKVRRGVARTALMVTGGLVIVAAIGGSGFAIGHYVGRPSRSASGAFPNGGFPQFPSGGFGRYYYNNGASPVTPTTLPANAPSTSDAAKIAAKVDAGVVDISTTESYQASSAAGTGMVLSSDGLVLTNNHVINGATSITVRVVTTNKTYSAKVLGYSVTQDVALLQLSGASGLAPVTTANSDSVTASQGVVAIGNAGGVGGTPSYAPGAVLATDQTVTAADPSNLTGAEKLSGMIQVAADIQAGDSGGPLVNTNGEVIGMDTAGSSTGPGAGDDGQYTSGTQGYAIPINTALSIVRTIQAGTSTATVHVGATPILGVEISPTLSGYQGSSVSGVQIAGLAAGTPAASSSLVAGDVITAINGQSVTTAAQLSAAVQKLAVGDSVKVTYTTLTGTSNSVNITLIAGPAL